MPPRIRPATSPEPDGGFDLATSFNVLIGSMQALDEQINQQTQMMSRQLDAQARFAMAGSNRAQGAEHAAGLMQASMRPQMRRDVMQGLASTGGMSPELTAGMTKMSGTGASTSLKNLQAYGAQWLGEKIAGQPLYEDQAQQGTRGGSTAGGAVPGAGAPTAPLPAGSGGAPGAPMPSPAGGMAGGLGWPVPGGGTGGSGTGPGGPGSGGRVGGGMPGGGGTPTPPASGANPPSGLNAIMQNAGARVAMSGGTGSGILSTLKHIPGVGLGLDLIEGVQNQREAGRVYQEQEGGTNLAAQRERLNALRYGVSALFNGMPEGAAAQAFGEVTALGYNRQSGAADAVGGQEQNRQSALNMIHAQYTGTGTSVQQSVQILETASQSAQVSLKSVSDAMTSLSNTAGKAGTNAEVARQNFNNLLNTAIGSGAGQGAPQLAGGIAAMQASYGKSFAGTSFSGQMSSGMQYMLSGQTGQTPGAIQSMMRQNPGEYQKLLSGSALQFVQNLPGMNSQLFSALQQMIQQAGGANAIKSRPDIAQQVGAQFLNQYQSQYNLDMNVWASYLSQVSGVQLTPSTVMQWVVEQLAGNSNASYAGVGGSGSGAPVSAKSASSGSSGAPTGQYGLAKGSTVPTGHGGNVPLSWQKTLQNDSSAASPYLSQESKSGQRSPVLEALLLNAPQGTQVAVKTASGTRVMNFQDAMKYYPNEMAAGDVQFYNSNGSALGGTSSITQGLVNSSANVTGEEASKGAGNKAGVSLSQWSKQHPGTTGGGVKIDLSSEARQLLKLLPSNSDQAAASSTVPTPPYVASPSR